jgi:hypothetical protein
VSHGFGRSGDPENIRRLLAVIKKDFDEAADLRVLNCSSDGGCVAADPWPRRGHQDHDAKANAAQVTFSGSRSTARHSSQELMGLYLQSATRI